MTFFRRLSIASAFATFLLVSVGGLVRATKSGLGCGTDWPDCSGRLTPALHDRAMVIEYSHRLAAGVVVLLLAALAVVAVVNHRRRPRIVWPALGAFLLVLAQAALGAIVVKLELEAESVVLHLAAALGLLGLLVYLSAAGSAAEHKLQGSSDRGASAQAMFAAGAVLVLLLVGSYLTGVGEAQNAGFPQWPLIDGELVPDLGSQVTALHWLHRLLAALVGVIVIVVALRLTRRKHDMPTVARLAYLVAGLYTAELLVGAGNVWTQSNQALNSAFVTLHLAMAALVWAGLVAIAVIAHPGLRHTAAEHVVHGRRPVLETGSR